jgi:hypothetical protein
VWLAREGARRHVATAVAELVCSARVLRETAAACERDHLRVLLAVGGGLTQPTVAGAIQRAVMDNQRGLRASLWLTYDFWFLTSRAGSTAHTTQIMYRRIHNFTHASATNRQAWLPDASAILR